MAGVRKIVVAAATVLATLTATTGSATAGVPSQQADATGMVDDTAFSVTVAGGHVWVGGEFDRSLTASGGAAGAAPGIAAFSVSSGAPASVRLPSLGSGPIVNDQSLGSNGVLYLAGKFTYQFGGSTRRNLVGIDPSSGAIEKGFSTPTLYSVLAMGDRVYAGGSKLEAYRTDGGRDAGFRAVSSAIDPSLRGHGTPNQFRDLVAHSGDVIAIGKFDFINGDPQKVAVRIDADSGQPKSWRIGGIDQRSAAYGLAGQVAGDRLYIAAGGSDFAAAYRAADGGQIWKTDTSGSAQAITMFDAATVIVGGHFQWVANSPGQQCGSNQSPNRNCLNQRRLVALNASNGAAVTSWRPQICCAYNGVWSVAVSGGSLHVAGVFTKAGGRNQRNYARFS
jgi:hypothetical protein